MQATVPVLLIGELAGGVEGCDEGLGACEAGMPAPGAVEVVPNGNPGQRPQYSLQPALQSRKNELGHL